MSGFLFFDKILYMQILCFFFKFESCWCKINIKKCLWFCFSHSLTIDAIIILFCCLCVSNTKSWLHILFLLEQQNSSKTRILCHWCNEEWSPQCIIWRWSAGISWLQITVYCTVLYKTPSWRYCVSLQDEQESVQEKLFLLFHTKRNKLLHMAKSKFFSMSVVTPIRPVGQWLCHCRRHWMEVFVNNTIYLEWQQSATLWP